MWNPTEWEEHRLYAPDEVDEVAWLVGFDSRPTMLPRMPASTRMTLVGVRVGQEGRALYHLPSEPLVNRFCREKYSKEDPAATLFFTIPTAMLDLPE